MNWFLEGRSAALDWALPELRCGRLDGVPVLADWAQEGWRSHEPQCLREVVSGREPELPTEVRVGWDSEALRVLFRVWDEAPWATLTERGEPLYTEEVVEVFLDPVGDGELYFELEVNVNNAVLECCARRVRSGYRKDFRWRCEGLRTAVQRDVEGWTAELAIPFLSLAVQGPRAGEAWRGNLTRIDRPQGKPRELSAWSPTGLAQFHVPRRFGWLRMEAQAGKADVSGPG